MEPSPDAALDNRPPDIPPVREPPPVQNPSPSILGRAIIEKKSPCGQEADLGLKMMKTVNAKRLMIRNPSSHQLEYLISLNKPNTTNNPFIGQIPNVVYKFLHLDVTSDLVTSYSSHLEQKHDKLLETLFNDGTYKKLYSYKHLINGFTAKMLRRVPGVKSVDRDWKVRKLTTHTPVWFVINVAAPYGPKEQCEMMARR
ncbi:hypothetical protein L1887_35416 [Cichorium endivia]|nr:hypothetical protein L1887_35416 [Cichorium endivia]